MCFAYSCEKFLSFIGEFAAYLIRDKEQDIGIDESLKLAISIGTLFGEDL